MNSTSASSNTSLAFHNCEFKKARIQWKEIGNDFSASVNDLFKKTTAEQNLRPIWTAPELILFFSNLSLIILRFECLKALIKPTGRNWTSQFLIEDFFSV